MKEKQLRRILACIMLYGVLLAAGVMLVGGVWYLVLSGSKPPGDHVFTGEPRVLRNVVAIMESALQGHDRSLIQLGVVLLLLNPLVRVLFAFFGYAYERNGLYTVVSGVVLAVLLGSFLL